MVDCNRCKHCIKHDPDDCEMWCEKGMYEEHPYQPIEECEYFEPNTKIGETE